MTKFGKITAIFFVGTVLAFSFAFGQDLAELQRKAGQGSATAQFKLGLMYDRGEGVPQDYAEAFIWYRKAAELGHASAQFNLGFMYTYGLGVPKNYTEALKWLGIAAGFGKGEVGEMAEKMRKDISAHMTRKQIAEADRLSREWLRKFNARKKINSKSHCKRGRREPVRKNYSVCSRGFVAGFLVRIFTGFGRTSTQGREW